MLDDMPKKQDFFKDVVFFDEQFNGIVPLQIIVDTKRKDGVFKLSTLKRLEKIENVIKKIPELSSPNSVTQIVKFAKQALGKMQKITLKCELLAKKNARRSLVANKKINKNEKFSLTNLTCKRPGNGISANRYFEYLGKKSKKNYK